MPSDNPPLPIAHTPTRRLIVVSNRLPLVFQRDEASGLLRARPGCGGLITALLPVLRNRGGVWIGWPGTEESDPEVEAATTAAGREAGYRMVGVPLTAAEVKDFYLGFSNRIIWPLFHDLQSLCDFDPAYWRTYQDVNRKYAQTVASVADAHDLLWVHDYHLMNVASDLRALGATMRMGFFLHIPFPPLDLFVKLPWRMAVLTAMLQFDVIGFQTVRDRRNFTDCVRALVPSMLLRGRGNLVEAVDSKRVVRIGSFPISIDYNQFERQAAAPEVAARTAELRGLLPDRKLLLGVDRLDYTKGIPHRLKAFRNALMRFPEMRERLSLIQVVVPSREDILEYQSLKLEIEHLVGEINGEFSKPGGWVPIWYVYTSLSRIDLLAYYRTAHIALVTPLKDGMNLVAKEYCACSIEEDAVLILSEFAGAAAQLHRGALLVNPYDIEGVADAIRRAWNMPLQECRARMRRLRRSVREHDVYSWLDSYLNVAFAQHLRDYPAFPADFAQSEPDYLPI
ncbi:MAG TPA: trehalose-6-phosphate synthase [Burkholderiales bacterium]|nr:trehalose-6-phosphate synthase [Burkholderiales bacterium]